jgi:hypothetical protein
MEWLKEHLSDGEPKLQTEIAMSAATMGYKADTLKTACDKLGTIIKTRPNPTGPWYWGITKSESYD